MGAPVKATPEVIATIVERVAEGMPISHAAALIGCNRNSITNWMKRKGFAAAIGGAKARFMQRQIGIIEQAGQNITKTGFWQWQAAAWLLERQFPEEFALQARPHASGSGFTLNISLAGGERLQIKGGAEAVALPGRQQLAIEATSSSDEG